MDANEAVAHVAYRVNEVIAIYPITPSSNMGEWADQWASEGITNIWAQCRKVTEMQSEGGRRRGRPWRLADRSLGDDVHGIAGLAADDPEHEQDRRRVDADRVPRLGAHHRHHALSIFGDHSDVMFCRTTGYALLCSNSVQEAMDLALIAHAASLEDPDSLPPLFDASVLA